MDLNEVFIIRIRELCEKKGFSIYQLAKLSGVPEKTLDSLMKHKSKNPRFDTIYKIAWGFSMTVDEFCEFPEFHNYYLKTTTKELQDE